MKKVSVLMTVYNGEKYVFDAIYSILNQTLEDFELIIVDDGSTDNTAEIIKSITDKRIFLVSLPTNKGVGYANNYAIQFAKGEYIAKMDADDISHPERLFVQYKFLKDNPNVDVVDSFIDYFTEDDELKKSERYQFVKNIYEARINKFYQNNELSRELYWFCNIVHSAVMYRKELTNHFQYPVDMRVCEDYFYFYNMNKNNVMFKKIPEKLLSVRLTDESITATSSEEIILNVLKIKNDEIKRFLKPAGKPYLIWGTGELARTTYKYIRGFLDIEHLKFIDSYPPKNPELFGREIVSPNDIDLSQFKIIVASSNGKYEIVEKIEEIGMLHLEDYIVIY